MVVDQALTPGQLRLLNKQLDVEVIDRTDVILRVFARRARTRMAQLEVELAGLIYEAPRVRDVQSLNDRTGGGGGRGERGHTNVELRKQEHPGAGGAHRDASWSGCGRRSSGSATGGGELPAVALVGYTNAGKSSLMRGLTGSDVLVEDKLFATLGTTVRARQPVDHAAHPGGRHGRLHQEPAARADQHRSGPRWTRPARPTCCCWWSTPPTRAGPSSCRSPAAPWPIWARASRRRC